MGRTDLAGAAHLELVSGVVQLRPEDAMVEAMLKGWRAQQVARGLREDTMIPRERLVRRFIAFTNEYPWDWGPSHAHLNDYEGDPEARPFTREELQRFFDFADDQVEWAVRAGRKGALAAYRDATLFKVVYGWGLRRTETSRLDVVDWGRNPGGAGVRPVRDAARALRRGGARAAAAAP